MARTTPAYAPARAARPAGALGLSGSAVKPGGSVVNLQGLPTMTLTLGKDSPGAGIGLDAPAAKAPEGLRKSTADKVACAK
ncbi:hypothetical protein VM636_18650 [Streptomyces sp. SCSIO 75703]|uniref:hypothetical protein n=1 Tax=Streptomyces sp. SCSIO 75703 TaxID=3112165 RepID=UPI0030D2A9FA